MNSAHEPRPEFVANLEWEIGSALRRHPEWRPSPMSRILARGRLAALIVLSVGVGAGAMVASEHYQDTRRRELLLARGINFVEVPEEEFDTLGCNVLAIAPRVCVMVKGNPKTKSLLERAGVEVIEFTGDEICLKGNGGPTCLTRPLQRLG